MPLKAETAPAVERLPYKPTTEFGKGFFPLLMRSWIRTLIVANAVFQKWPITLEAASAELSEGFNYWTMIKQGTLLQFSGATTQQLAFLNLDYRRLEDDLRKEHEKNPTGPIPEWLDARLRSLTEGIFVLLAELDKETLGLNVLQTDAGKKL